MKYAMVVGAALAAFTPAFALAQHTSYAGQQSREIKALSAEETKQYLGGAGMSYALAAELNHYPGPMHVLELAEKLALTSQQRVATQRLMDTHRAEARSIGAKVVEAERALDLLFAGGMASEKALAERVGAVAVLQGSYRLSHLNTHLRLRSILTSEQVRRYDELRGYTVGASGGHDRPKHGHPPH